MTRSSLVRAASFSINVLLISSMLLTLLGIAWEYSTRWYLSGFANAVLPYSSSHEQKVVAILSWMEQGPARETEYYSDDSENRDPVDTLNYRELLHVCGTATNAFVNLASAGGIESRRLLLLDAQEMSTNHVVAEVRLDGRWIVVDPTFHAILKDATGHLLTRQDLARPEVFQDATKSIPHYDPRYNYEHTAFIHFARLPVVGHFLQTSLNPAFMGWLERVNWTMLLERQSFSIVVLAISLLCVAIFLRRVLSWYGRKFSIIPVGPWEQLRRAGISFFSSSASGESQNAFSAERSPRAPTRTVSL